MRPEDVEILDVMPDWTMPEKGWWWWVDYRKKLSPSSVRSTKRLSEYVMADDELGAIAAFYKKLGVEDE